MLGIAETNACYQGVLDIKKKFGSKIIHVKSYNHGEQELFKVVCKALAGYNIYSEVPSYVKIENRDDGTSVLLRDKLNLSGGNYSEAVDGYKVTYSVDITSKDLNHYLIKSSGTYNIAMYSRSHKCLATAPIEASVISDIPESMVLIIDWNMIFKNSSNEGVGTDGE